VVAPLDKVHAGEVERDSAIARGGPSIEVAPVRQVVIDKAGENADN